MEFINPVMNQEYQIRAGQADCDVIITRLNWRSKLSRITPRVAEFMLQAGTNLFTRKNTDHVNLRQNEPADNEMGDQNPDGTNTGNEPAGDKSPGREPEPAPGKPKHKEEYKKKRGPHKSRRV